jgi:hypothetical protein
VEGKLPRASLPDGGFVLFVPAYGILHKVNGFLPGDAYPLAAS